MRSIESMQPPKGAPPKCTTCSAPAYNVNQYNEYTGRHSTIEECLQGMQFRLADLEKKLRELAAVVVPGNHKP